MFSQPRVETANVLKGNLVLTLIELNNFDVLPKIWSNTDIIIIEVEINARLKHLQCIIGVRSWVIDPKTASHLILKKLRLQSIMKVV